MTGNTSNQLVVDISGRRAVPPVERRAGAFAYGGPAARMGFVPGEGSVQQGLGSVLQTLVGEVVSVGVSANTTAQPAKGAMTQHQPNPTQCSP
jgi:hypothetical protein